jgi:hypothetical protein
MMKFRAGLAAFGSLTLVAGCTMEAKQEDNALVKAGFTKTNPSAPGAASIAKSDPILYLHFLHRTVNGVPMVFYYDPVACKWSILEPRRSMRRISRRKCRTRLSMTRSTSVRHNRRTADQTCDSDQMIIESDRG